MQRIRHGAMVLTASTLVLALGTPAHAQIAPQEKRTLAKVRQAMGPEGGWVEERIGDRFGFAERAARAKADGQKRLARVYVGATNLAYGTAGGTVGMLAGQAATVLAQDKIPDNVPEAAVKVGGALLGAGVGYLAAQRRLSTDGVDKALSRMTAKVQDFDAGMEVLRTALTQTTWSNKQWHQMTRALKKVEGAAREFFNADDTMERRTVIPKTLHRSMTRYYRMRHELGELTDLLSSAMGRSKELRDHVKYARTYNPRRFKGQRYVNINWMLNKVDRAELSADGAPAALKPRGLSSSGAMASARFNGTNNGAFYNNGTNNGAYNGTNNGTNNGFYNGTNNGAYYNDINDGEYNNGTNNGTYYGTNNGTLNGPNNGTGFRVSTVSGRTRTPRPVSAKGGKRFRMPRIRLPRFGRKK